MRLSFLFIFILLGAECTVRLAEWQGVIKLHRLKDDWYESVYYHYLNSPPSVKTPPQFDRLLGWRNKPPFQNVSSSRVTLNSQGWRSATGDFPMRHGRKKRIAVVGDSFAFGAGVSDEESFPYQLEKKLGSGFEVLNFSARGHGLDQMALVATEVVKAYAPDYIVVAFISDDLLRSCRRFQFNARKPYYAREGGDWKLRGVPVPTPYETYEEHASQRATDALRTWLLRSRFIQAVGELVLWKGQQRCLDQLPAFLIGELERIYGKNFSLLHLQGFPPAAVERTAYDRGISFLSLATHASHSHFLLPDGHPRPELHAAYARDFVPSIVLPFP